MYRPPDGIQTVFLIDQSLYILRHLRPLYKPRHPPQRRYLLFNDRPQLIYQHFHRNPKNRLEPVLLPTSVLVPTVIHNTLILHRSNRKQKRRVTPPARTGRSHFLLASFTRG